jgi:3-phenylpropionate/trans-cinnamate dioxygenase ferredoxin reductase subunit
MNDRLLRTAWLTGLGTIVAGPPLLWLATAPPEPLLSRLAVVSGFFALTVLVCAAILPSRLRSLNRAFGIESVMEVHRFFGVSAVVLVLVHLAVVVANDPRAVALLSFPSAPPRAQAATAATLALVLLVGVVALKKRLRLTYETWRWMHIGLASAALVFSALHVLWLNHALLVPAMSAAFLVLVAIVFVVAFYRWVWRGLLDPSTEFVIHEVRSESPTISTVVLAPLSTDAAWNFAPGQFAWVRMGRSPAAEEHPFTISSSSRDHFTTFTVRHAGDFTRTLTALTPGTPVWIDGPHGAFSGDVGECSGFILLAGGVGITPMMSMLRTAADRGDRRPYRLVVVASRQEDLLFREELGFLRSTLDLVVTEVMRRPSDDWEGHYGALSHGLLSLVLGSTDKPESVDFFLCGPPAMIHDALEVIDDLEVDPGRVHTELFDFV